MYPHIRRFDSASFTFDEFRVTLERMSLIGHLETADTVNIKPNLCAGNLCDCASGVVSNRDVLDAVCGFIRRINPGCRLRIMESDSTGNGFAFLKFEAQEYPELAQRHRAELIDLSRGRLVRVDIPNPFYFKEGIWLHEALQEPGFFISLAKIKTHNVTRMSCCLKNLFGCLPTSDKKIYHVRINEVIADVNMAIRTDLCICEGLPALEGNGPVCGTPKDIGVVVMADDPVACDAYISQMIGIDPAEVRHLELSARHGVGSGGFSALDFRSDGGELPLAFIPCQQQVILKTGLAIQRFGELIVHFGHLLHLQQSLPQMLRGVKKRVQRKLFTK